jgi:alkanesulfonate monooxygenase SsuD/methylene tetrahydromethanopterin reductase-like flavin-dependent oxidoreductase (luciferase family)
MKFGLLVSNFNSLQNISDCTIQAEKVGFDSVLYPDHYIWGGGGQVAPVSKAHSNQPFTSNTFEVLPLLAYAAAKTNTIKLGTGVLILNLRSPAILAKMIATIDHLTNGRLILGIGNGWNKTDFDAYAPKEWVEGLARIKKTEEGVKLMLELWTEKVVDFHGTYYEAKNAPLEPKPLQKPYPQLWFGGYGKNALIMAARYGNAWVSGPVLDKANLYFEKVSEIKKNLQTLGRRGNFTFAAMGAFLPNDGTAPPGFYYPIHGEFKDIGKRLEQYIAAGCEYYIPWFVNEERSLELTTMFGSEIIPSYCD